MNDPSRKVCKKCRCEVEKEFAEIVGFNGKRWVVSCSCVVGQGFSEDSAISDYNKKQRRLA